MGETIASVKVNNRVVKLYYSEGDSRSWDNISRMIFFGNYQHIGDKHDVVLRGEFDSRQDFIERGEQMVRKQLKDVVICKAVHLYNHSGISISTSYSYPYNCRWDSGTIGFLVVTKEDIRKNWNIKRVTQHYIDWAEELAESELNTLDQEIAGDVYGFVLYDEDGEVEDSCGGFYGSDLNENGMGDYLDQIYIDALVNVF